MGERPALGSFLRARRARVTPAAMGVAAGGRRRVDGLRRQEVAERAGISVEYYQRLEQGRAAHPSPDVVDALARALGLDPVERAHLHTLANLPRHATTAAAPATPPVRPALARLLELMDRVPALVIDDTFTVLAANPLAVRLLTGAAAAPPGDGNLARHLFLDPGAQAFYGEWDEVAAATAGQLRRVAARHPDDAAVATLVADLSAGSPTFRRLWAAEHVELRTSGAKSFRHPALGALTLSYENLELPDGSRQRLVTFVAEAASPSEAALQLLARWAGTGPAGPEPSEGDHSRRPAHPAAHPIASTGTTTTPR